MCGTGPLAIDYFVKVVRIENISCVHLDKKISLVARNTISNARTQITIIGNDKTQLIESLSVQDHTLVPSRF